MKKFLSTKYSKGGFNLAMLILRLGVGVLLASHGYDKLIHFHDMENKFMNFLSLGQTVSLSLVVFAEFFCAILLILGLFTRFAAIPIIVVMSVALFKVHDGQLFSEGEKATIYLAGALTILLCGPGRISIDGIIGR
jgi:putative oxidoreductase